MVFGKRIVSCLLRNQICAESRERVTIVYISQIWILRIWFHCNDSSIFNQISYVRIPLYLLPLISGWCKPSSKSFEDVDYNDDAQADDSDDYSQNDDESDTPDTIEEPPQIKSNPESKRVRSGTTVTLPCLTSNAGSCKTKKKERKKKDSFPCNQFKSLRYYLYLYKKN